MARARKLTDSEKAENVKAGLTPTGQLPVSAEDRAKAKAEKAKRQITKASEAPVGRRSVSGKGGFPVGDYRSLGKHFSTLRRNHYLRVVRECGEEPLARAEVGVSLSAVKRLLKNDELFREALAEAYRQHASIYAKEMKRRGVDGWQEPVFGSQGKDAGTGIVGWVTKYSDRLLLEQARRFNKEYTPKAIVEQTTEIVAKPLMGLDKLSPESREDLRKILEREKIRLEELATSAAPETPDDADEPDEE